MTLVRPFEDGDAPALTELLTEMARSYGASVDPNLPVANDVVRRAREVDILVACSADRLLGFVTFASLYPVGGLIAFTYVQQIYVSADARRRGIARDLMAAVARAAKARGCGRIEWSTGRDNAAARTFYESLGAVGAEKVSYTLTGAALERLADTGGGHPRRKVQ